MTLSLEVYTIQMAQWRIIKNSDVELEDVTLKSGNKAFSPTPGLLHQSKSGQITPEEYTTVYSQLMEESKRINKKEWVQLFEKKKIALACYCGADQFCHRHLLLNELEAFAKDNEWHVIRRGELKKGDVYGTP